MIGKQVDNSRPLPVWNRSSCSPPCIARLTCWPYAEEAIGINSTSTPIFSLVISLIASFTSDRSSGILLNDLKAYTIFVYSSFPSVFLICGSLLTGCIIRTAAASSHGNAIEPARRTAAAPATLFFILFFISSNLLLFCLSGLYYKGGP